MPRPKTVAANRRTLSRVDSVEEVPVAVVVEPVARARGHSSSSSEASSSAVSSFLDPKTRSHQRAYLQRTSQEQRGPNDNLTTGGGDLPVAKKPSSSTTHKSPRNSRARKRRPPANESSPLFQQAGHAKKRKGSRPSSLSIESDESHATRRGPLTRGQKAALQVITPSPADTKTKSAGPSFNFSSPRVKKRCVDRFELPDGVIDLYPSSSGGKGTCKCGQDDCSANALTSRYIHSYGKEYSQYLRDTETPDIILAPKPSPGASTPSSSNSTQSVLRSPDLSAASPSSALSAETPEHNRDWVFLNSGAVDASQPNESSAYLPYQPDLTPKMRSILVDWLIELSEHFNFGHTTLHLAVTLVDKVLACGPIRLDEDSGDEDDSDNMEDESKTNCFLISRERFQLLGAACTWLACKIEELSPPCVDEFAYVSDNIYTTFQIKRMERRICKALNFACWHKTPLLFTYEFIRASHECPSPCCHSNSSALFHNMVMYMLEIGRIPYIPVTKKPSLLAAAAVYLARVNLGVRSNDTTLDPHGRWTRTLEYYTGYSKAELKETVLAIHGYHLAAEESTLKSVFAKFKSKTYLKVALKTVPNESDLGF
jgi:hypothetical protein